MKTGRSFETAGKADKKDGFVEFKISHRIIQLFSEGLYSSPNKAVEELVSNSFDANAKNVNIFISKDLHSPDATIAIIDDGTGMGSDDLKSHWIVGHSTKRQRKNNARNPIGKFGIGKLSTYVLASKFTHITKSEGNYYGVTMDYSEIMVNTPPKGVFDEKSIQIPLRKLTEQDARKATREWTEQLKSKGSPKLFGAKAPNSWTVAIMSELKEMGRNIELGRLTWILKTAMPQRSDFSLFLNGKNIESPKIQEPWKKIILGKSKNPPSCPEGFVVREKRSEYKESIHRYGIYHELLGRVTGYIEIFENRLDTGKEKFEQSNGFFVYVNERRVNGDDPGFGIDRNVLKLGTFSRFRMVVHIDKLDDILRSSRESFQQGDLYQEAQDFLYTCFKEARNKLDVRDKELTPAHRMFSNLADAPKSITRTPLLALMRKALEGDATPFYLRSPEVSGSKTVDSMLSEFEEGLNQREGLLDSTKLDDLESDKGIAIFDAQQSKVVLNCSHPFVASFQDAFEHKDHRYPLETLVMMIILGESYLYHKGLDEDVIQDTIGRSDAFLRQSVKSSGHRTVGKIVVDLLESKNDPKRLEKNMRACFEAMGFNDVFSKGGKNEPDGIAIANLSARIEGESRRYVVGLEAKSRGTVSANRLDVSRIEKHMKQYKCDHHLVIGNGFATSEGAISSTVEQIRNYRERSNKTITLMHIGDLARLTRIVSIKRIGGLTRIRYLFRECVTPEESKEWIDNLNEEPVENRPYKEILEAIQKLARDNPLEPVEYAAIIAEMRHINPPIKMSKNELIECCRAMQVIVPDSVYAEKDIVHIERRADLILEDMKKAIADYPEEERKHIHI